MIRFTIGNKLGKQSFDHASGPIEFGRGPERDGILRCTINDGYVSANHVRVDEQPDGYIRLENLSARNSIRLADNSVVEPGKARLLKAPIQLTIGETLLEIEHESDPIRSGAQAGFAATPGGGAQAGFAAMPQKAALKPANLNAAQAAAALGKTLPPKVEIQENNEAIRAPTPEKLMSWFETFVAVQQAATGSLEFYRQTAEAVVKLVGLERGMVILQVAKPTPALRWMVQARYPSDGDNSAREFSLTILEYVLKKGETYFQAAKDLIASDSLAGLEAVVASPIKDAQKNIIGFVYGSRSVKFTKQAPEGIGPLEAQVMQVLAASVATGLARQQHEFDASRARVQFEQFVSAEVAQELQNNPHLLQGQEREITVMFADIRSFSRISERLGPKLTCELVADVMDRLTNCIRACEGTVVDYAGDGLMAMWNAPATQPNHALLGCKAALSMQEILLQIDADWQERIGAPIRVGVGLNTGPAMCGNTGSKSRFKYGPLGHAVNLASRVEGATKAMGVPVLITHSTKQLIGDVFATRRLCKVRVVGIQGAVDFYELFAENAPPEWTQRRNTYEAALGLFEQGQFGYACQKVYPLLAGAEGSSGGDTAAPVYDVPCLNLITRCVEYIKYPPEKFDGILELTSK